MTTKDKEFVAVRLQNATLDDGKDDVIVAHGWLDLEALELLHVGDYQREILDYSGGAGRKSPILKGIEGGARLPDIILGMRGQKFTTRGSAMHLENDVYIVDGLQRVSALKRYAMTHPEMKNSIRIGAEVRFSTDRNIERDLFTTLNTQRKAMSPNVLLRNARTESNGILTIYGLTTSDAKFPLYGKVCWNQQMNRNEVVTALSVCKTAGMIHSYFGPGKIGSGVSRVGGALDTIAKKVSLKQYRENINTFFEAVDEIWGIRGIKYTDKCTHMRMNFMVTLANIMADHDNFWEDTRLVIDKAAISKLKSFPINDPTVIRLAAAGTTSGLLLYNLMRDHLNKSKRVNQLVPRRRTSVPKED